MEPKSANQEEHNSKKTVVYCKFEEIKAKVGKVGIFTSNNFNVISFEINQRKTFSLSDKIHFFSLLYKEKLVIFIHLRCQRNLLNGKPVENHFFSLYAGIRTINVVKNEKNSFEV